MQRAPLPHISPTEPSLLKNSMRKSPSPWAWSTTMKPSAPRERWGVQRVLAMRGKASGGRPSSRLLRMMKSLPAPFIFQNFMVLSHFLRAAEVCGPYKLK